MNIHKISYQENFFSSVFQGFIVKYPSIEENPGEWLNVTFVLPNRRSCRELTEFFANQFSKKPSFLPKIIAISDAGSNLPKSNTNLQPLSKLHQNALITKILDDVNNIAYGSNSYRMAIDLSNLLGEISDFQVNRDELIAKIEQEIAANKFASHWERNLQFLKVILQFLPEIFKEKNLTDYSNFRNQVIEKQIEIWQDELLNNDQKLIFLGIDNQLSIFTTLYEKLANMANCHFILKGEMQNENFSSLFNELKLDSNQIKLWHEKPVKKSSEIKKITAKDEIEEAKIISLILRRFIAQKKGNAAIITSNRKIARIISENLLKIGINVNDSEGEEFRQTKAGSFFFSLIELIQGEFQSINLLDFLKNPLNTQSISQVQIAEFEINFLRNVRSFDNLFSLLNNIKKQSPNLAKNLREALSLGENFFEHFEKKSKTQFSIIFKDHRTFFQKITENQQNEELTQFSEFLNNIEKLAEDLGEISIFSYIKILDVLFVGNKFRPRSHKNCQIQILNPNEAFLLNFDLTLFTSLNEGIYPTSPIGDLFLTEKIRQELKMPHAENRLAKQSYIFSCYVNHENIYLTQSRKNGNSAATSSRFMEQISLEKEIIDETGFWRYVSEIDEKNLNSRIPSKIRPSFIVPNAAKPKKISVSKLEKLIKDPYGYYIGEILKLKKLKQIDEDPTNADFGNVVHEILDRFNEIYEQSQNLSDDLEKISNYVLQKFQNMKALHRIWQARIKNLNKWILDFEYQRRDDRKVMSEITGEITFNLDNESKIVVTAKADRIEIKDQQIIIIDYKTGAAPTNSEIFSGYSPQMLTEALIAQKKGFIKQTFTDIQLAFVKIQGRSDHNKYQEINPKNGIFQFMQAHEKNLIAILNHYFSKESSFTAIPNPIKSPKFNDLSHLERVNDWNEA